MASHAKAPQSLIDQQNKAQGLHPYTRGSEDCCREQLFVTEEAAETTVRALEFAASLGPRPILPAKVFACPKCSYYHVIRERKSA